MGRLTWSLAAGLTVALGTTGALAQSSAETWEICRQYSHDLSIEACSAIVNTRDETDANLAEAYYHRGFAHRIRGDYDWAIHNLDQAIRLRPSEANFWVVRGDVYRDKGHPDRAIEDYDQAIRVNPSSAFAFNARGTVHGRMDRYDRAIQDYDQAIRLNPSYEIALANRCLARAIVDQLALALDDCNESLRLQADFNSALGYRALVHLKAGRHDAAIADYEAVLPRVRSADMLYGRGLALRRKGDEPGAEADIAEAKKLDGNVAERFAKYGVR